MHRYDFFQIAWFAQATNDAGLQMMMLTGIPDYGVTKNGVSGHPEPQGNRVSYHFMGGSLS